jgi:hypothetical protein
VITVAASVAETVAAAKTATRDFMVLIWAPGIGVIFDARKGSQDLGRCARRLPNAIA